MSGELQNLDNTISLPKVLEEVCLKNKNRAAIVFDRQEITYQELNDKAEQLATSLSIEGIGKHDRVGIILDDCVEYIFLYYALAKLGAVSVPLCDRWEEPEILNVLEDSEVQYIIYTTHIGVKDFHRMLKNIKPKLFSLKKMFVQKVQEIVIEYCDKLKDFNDLFQAQKIQRPPVNVDSDDDFVITYTSGTTGTPKGVVLRHGEFTRLAQTVSTRWPEIDNKSVFCIAPLYAGAGFCAFFTEFLAEYTVHFISSKNPNDILKEISKGEIAVIQTQPTMWAMLLSSTILGFCNFSSIEFMMVNGSICPPTLAQKIEETVGCPLLNVYGLIEASGVVTSPWTTDDYKTRMFSVGSQLPGVEIKIIDENGQEVKKGEEGELAVRGYVMKEYFNSHEKTQAAIDSEGWLLTGDLATYYDDNNITIVGRKKEMLIRGGFNVYPSDIEDIIFINPNVQQVAVVGKSHEVIGEQTVAFIVPKPNKVITRKDIIELCKGKLANYKIPDIIHFVAEMPIILTGKYDKKTLKNWAENGIPEEFQLI